MRCRLSAFVILLEWHYNQMHAVSLSATENNCECCHIKMACYVIMYLGSGLYLFSVEDIRAAKYNVYSINKFCFQGGNWDVYQREMVRGKTIERNVKARKTNWTQM